MKNEIPLIALGTWHHLPVTNYRVLGGSVLAGRQKHT